MAWIVDSASRPIAISDSPAVTTRLVPSRSTKRADSGATIIIVSACGISRMPAWSGVYPCTSCQYCVIRNIEPNSAKNVERDRAARRREPRVAEHAHVEHRVGGVLLPAHEPDEGDGGDHERGHDDVARPALLGSLDDAEQQRRQPDDRQDRAERVESGLLGVARLRNDEGAEDERRERRSGCSPRTPSSTRSARATGRR